MTADYLGEEPFCTYEPRTTGQYFFRLPVPSRGTLAGRADFGFDSDRSNGRRRIDACRIVKLPIPAPRRKIHLEQPNTGTTQYGRLLLAYGGPDSLDDIPEYLSDIRGGRPTPQPLIDDITERYRLIGGRSPLLSITRSVAAKLQALIGCPVYVGMRHWSPFIKEVVEQMAGDGIQQIGRYLHGSPLQHAQHRQVS